LAELILNEKDTNYALSKVYGYYSDFDRIDDYFRETKIERLSNTASRLFPVENEFFHDFDMSPMDMEFEIIESGKGIWNDLFVHIGSFPSDENPGKNIRFLVKEKNTNTVVGFIRLGSPTINSKPRNDMLGGPPNLSKLNEHIIMGFVIVPAQPFGFNYLGGKLLTGICCSHYMRRYINKKYGVKICGFETTSLYGNIKSCSQYDGMKPFIRHVGETESRFLLTMMGKEFYDLNDWYTMKNDGEPIIHREASSRKLKIQTKMLSVIKASLKSQGRIEERTKFSEFIEDSIDNLTTRKRQYWSDYGFSNVVDVMLGKEKELQKKENYDRYELQNVIEWWKKKATKRYNSLLSDGRLRTESEVWTEDNMNTIDIIR